ncbi:helix-turn-helix transcriptional regulator [Radiobacillus deserti]|uniref:Helix-turn-helix transcriptional regulator n=1 Tax=Radiobacillus deserti TaxID=2594883 RepID=A0A516KHC8_9BACI|nr:helix-turn-helix transcriptional regulator [Radiobacillus deserti]QDP40794.1 helix-turn-helix transcriptional regulator [Radiobacillus deserti]
MRTWLKQYRILKSLTQEETAKKSKISRSYYTHIEKGTKTPTVPVAKSIAETLDFEWLIFFDSQCSFKEHNETK